jgi:hypothetical protein
MVQTFDAGIQIINQFMMHTPKRLKRIALRPIFKIMIHQFEHLSIVSYSMLAKPKITV